MPGDAPAGGRDVAGRVGEVAAPAALARLLEARLVILPIGDAMEIVGVYTDAHPAPCAGAQAREVRRDEPVQRSA